MCAQSRYERDALPDDPVVREIAWILALLVASSLLGWIVLGGVEWLVDLLTATAGRRLTGTVVYAGLGLAALAAVYAVARRLDVVDRPDRFVLVEVAGIAVVLGFVGAYILHGAVRLQPYPRVAVDPLLSAGVVTVLPAVVYVRLRGIDLRLDGPDEQARALAVVLGLVSLFVGLSYVAAFSFVDGWGPFAVGGPFGQSPLTPGTLFWRVLFPNVALGAGAMVLYQGAIHEGLADVTTTAGAVAAVTALLGVNAWATVAVGLLTGTRPAGDVGLDLAQAGLGVAGVILAVGAAALALRGTDALVDGADRDDHLGVGAFLGVLVAVVPLSVLTAAGVAAITAVISGLSFAVATAVATVGYARSRSIWVPVFAFAVYRIAVDPNLAVALAAVLG